MKTRATNAFGFSLGILIGIFCILFVLAYALAGIETLADWARAIF